MSASTQLQVPLKESQGFLPSSLQKRLNQSCASSLSGLKKDIAELDKHIEALVSSDKKLQSVYQVVESGQGIGKMGAKDVLILFRTKDLFEGEVVFRVKETKFHAV